ncbi:hypothetical protein VM1G_11384 [Cytospora mali]|uniref:Uncharacterized protein n=1 Tax=Cytospora mali TaxID=578113 RepID=A0A194VRF2_CYTMA|nr:hypothetical protein VM1G_11384 [Valsa mali]
MDTSWIELLRSQVCSLRDHRVVVGQPGHLISRHAGGTKMRRSTWAPLANLPIWPTGAACTAALPPFFTGPLDNQDTRPGGAGEAGEEDLTKGRSGRLSGLFCPRRRWRLRDAENQRLEVSPLGSN